PQTSSRGGEISWPRLLLYLCPQFFHGVEHDATDGDQLVDAAAVLTLRPRAHFSSTPRKWLRGKSASRPCRMPSPSVSCWPSLTRSVARALPPAGIAVSCWPRRGSV